LFQQRFISSRSSNNPETCAADTPSVRARDRQRRSALPNGRDVRTRWEKQRLISETSLGSAKVTETYERSTSGTQLIVTTKMDMHGRELSVRRVYDAEGLQ